MAITSSSVAIDLVKQISHCRACGSGQLEEILDLGVHAVSDFYVEVPSDELRAPLTLVQCAPCGLVQLTHSVSRDRLYKDYWYRSGLNPSMVEALYDVVMDISEHVQLKARDAVLDIGANDGTLLAQYPYSLDRFGVEPSNLWREARDMGLSVVEGYYPQVRPSRHFKAISSIAMFYDLDDPNAFVKAIKEDLHPEGVWVNQMMDLQMMLRQNAVDNICHEHVAYWSYETFRDLVASHGLRIQDVTYHDVNGGSLRTVVKHGQPIEDYFAPDHANDRLRAFIRRLPLLKYECLQWLEMIKRQGLTVLGYGASTKGNTLLQYYGITTDLLPAIADRNPDKVGKITAGSHIPIISEEEMHDRRPDYLLVLPWGFLDHFVDREKERMAQGMKLLVPLPTFRVVEA